MGRILISGGSGLLGRKLTDLLRSQGKTVAHLSRTAREDMPWPVYGWDYQKGYIDPQAWEDTETIIHLAGAGIADKPWTQERKKVLRESRVKTTELLLRESQKHGAGIKNFIGASAIGFYGIKTTPNNFSEEDPPGDDFLADICEEWENEVKKFEEIGVRTVRLRVGVVLSPAGGALPKMALPVKFGAGARLGSGKQYLPWVHIDDMVGMFAWAVNNQVEGVFNGVAPEAADNRQFTKVLAKTLKRPLFLPPVPAFVIKMIMGEMSTMALEGSRVTSKKIEAAGYQFQYPTLKEALEEIYRKS